MCKLISFLIVYIWNIFASILASRLHLFLQLFFLPRL